MPRLGTVLSSTTVDTHTYVMPAMELVYNESSDVMRSHWSRIEQHLALTMPIPGLGDWPTPYLRVQEYDGILEGLLTSRQLHPLPTLASPVLDLDFGILHDNPMGRLKAMDRLGSGVHVINPALRLDVDAELGSAVTRTILAAYNRYAVWYCSHAPERLKTVIQPPRW